MSRNIREEMGLGMENKRGEKGRRQNDVGEGEEA